jgi:hypothetical protein
MRLALALEAVKLVEGQAEAIRAVAGILDKYQSPDKLLRKPYSRNIYPDCVINNLKSS